MPQAGGASVSSKARRLAGAGSDTAHQADERWLANRAVLDSPVSDASDSRWAVREAGTRRHSRSREIQDAQIESRPVLHLGKRLLEIDLTMPEAQDYDASVALAQSAGAEVTSLSIYWDDIEVGTGMFRPDPNRLAIANQYYPAHKM